jgi:D-beta-D-heptose 7-phosphate kinase/D-beta-D-heptose 1-phosphate adenosyltransferase
MNSLLTKDTRILIIGDAILDIYHFGRVDRVSPEAPVPVVQVTKSKKKLGGAANVANNIAKLHLSPILLGYCGQDYNSVFLKELLSSNSIPFKLVEITHPTITKVRIIGGIQQIVRVDFEEKINSDSKIEEQLRQYIDSKIDTCDVIILSDYGKGLVTDSLSQYLIEKCNQSNKMIIIDPKGSNWCKYKSATIITPNVKELSDVYGKRLNNEDIEIEIAGKEIIQKFQLQYLLVTRSEKGMTFFEKNKIHHIRTTATEVFDVSGAGDTVVATLASAVASSYSWLDAVKLANKAAGIVVSKIGTEPITYKELASSTYEYKEKSKIISENQIQELIHQLKQSGKKIVFTNGCFDIIHKGHIKYLQQAKSKGDILILGLNSDSSVKRLKGPERPIKNEDERALILSAMEVIDYVVIFDTDTPYEIIKKIKPDVLAKGGDYLVENVVGREFAKETILIPFVEGYSTTSTISKLKI